MKTLVFVLLIFLFQIHVGQTIQWNQELKYNYSGKYPSQSDKSIPIVHNSLGDIFGTITFQDRFYFDKDSLNRGDKNGFIAYRMDKDGHLKYKSMFNATKYVLPMNATAQHSDNFYISLKFGGKLYFNDSLIAQDDTFYNYRNCVIMLNGEGKIKWFKSYRSMTHDYFAMTDDKNGKLTIRPSKHDLGRFVQDSSFFTLGGYSDGLVRFDPDGAVILGDSISGYYGQLISSPSGNYYGELRFLGISLNPIYESRDTFYHPDIGRVNFLFTLRDSNFKPLKHYSFNNRIFESGFFPNDEYGKYVYVDDSGNLTCYVPFTDTLKYRDSVWYSDKGSSPWLLVQFDSSGRVNWTVQPQKNIISVGMRVLGTNQGYWVIYAPYNDHVIQGHTFPGNNPIPYIVYVQVGLDGKVKKYHAEYFNKNTQRGMRMLTIADNTGVYVANTDTVDFYTYYKLGGTKRVNITKLVGNIFPLSKEKVWDDDLRIYIYPNPAQDNLNIELPDNLTMHQAHNLSMICTDLQGRTIRKWSVFGDKNLVIDIRDILPGIYMLGIVHANGVSWVKWVKM